MGKWRKQEKAAARKEKRDRKLHELGRYIESLQLRQSLPEDVTSMSPIEHAIATLLDAADAFERLPDEITAQHIHSGFFVYASPISAETLRAEAHRLGQLLAAATVVTNDAAPNA